MAEAKITKQRVKNYLELENKKLASEMKEKIERTDRWGEFKKEFVGLIVEFASNPTVENKYKLDNLIESYYISNRIFAIDALERIFKDLGIKGKSITTKSEEKPRSSSDSKEEYRRKIYEDLGIEYAGDIRREGQKEVKDFLKDYYGIKKDSEKTKTKKTTKTRRKLSSLLISDPEEASPEVLAENREMIENASQKLEAIMTELEKARVDISSKNDARKIDIPEDILSSYSNMIDGEMDEEYFEMFETALKQKQEKQLQTIRDTFEYLQKARLEKTLKELVLSKFEDMPPKEVDAEIEYAMLDSKVNKDGKLVLPKRSIFKDLMFDENGELLPGQAELATSIITYGSVKKVSEFSNEEIGNAVNEFVKDHPEMLPEDSKSKLKLIEDTSKEYMLTKDIAEETELRHKMLISEEIKQQFEKIKKIVKSYDEKEHSDAGLSKSEARRREAILRIARKKVTSLEKTGLSSLIAEGEKTSEDIIKKAKDVLLPRLEATRNQAKRRINKEFDASELGETDERE